MVSATGIERGTGRVLLGRTEDAVPVVAAAVVDQVVDRDRRADDHLRTTARLQLDQNGHSDWTTHAGRGGEAGRDANHRTGTHAHPFKHKADARSSQRTHARPIEEIDIEPG